MQIIGLSGKANSGKDYIADHFLTPQGFFRFSLAWHFKVWLVGKGEATYEEVFHTKPPHIRKLLQEEGTERGRMVYGENIWSNTMYTWFKVLEEHCGVSKFIIPDVRFISEVNAVKAMGGKVFRIQSPKRVEQSSLTPEARLHISETELDSYTDFDDGVILNDPEFADSVEFQISNLLDFYKIT